MKNFKFSLVVLVENDEKQVDRFIESILDQSISFEKDVQLIFIDNDCRDKSLDICRDHQKRHPENIVVLEGENLTRNDAFDHIEGEYVNFINIHERLSKNALKKIHAYFEKNKDIDVVHIPSLTLQSGRKHKLCFKFERKREKVDLISNPYYFIPFLNASFIRNDALKGYSFNRDLPAKQESFFLNNIMIDNPKYALLDDGTEYFFVNPTEQRHPKIDDDPSKREFLESFFNVYCRKLIDQSIEKYGRVVEFVQFLLTYEICEFALVSEISDIFDEAESEEFMKSVLEVLDYIELENILETPKISYSKQSYLIYLKRRNFNIAVIDGEPCIRLGDLTIQDLNEKFISFDYVEKKQGFLNIAGFFKSNCDNEFMSVEAIKIDEAGKKTSYPGKYNNYLTYRPDVMYLGTTWEFYYNFDIRIPVGEDENCRVLIKVNYSENGKEFSLYPQFTFTTYCSLSHYSHYFVKGSKIVIFTENSFKIVPFSFLKTLKFEFSSVKKIITTSRRPQFLYSIFIRMIYLLSYPFMKNRRIWLFSDRPTNADDNAKHLFTYAIAQDDGIEKYFVVEKGVPDYKEMKKISKNVLAFQSLKNKIYYLYAEKIIVSHIIDKFAHPLAYRNKRLYAGLAESDKYFLQHGVIEGDLSDRLNKPMRFLAMFLTSADGERNSIIYNNYYNFDENRVPALGLPRFDTLTNENVNKQILLIPTWRSYIRDEDSLLESEYFKKLMSLLTNERLLEKMSQTGYTFVFKLHPELYPYAEYFNIESENVVLSKGEHYQDFFNKSSVLITDYSTVAFDFAYLKKPVIYYQYADEYHYSKGYFDFETMGFGDVIEMEDDLVDKIINYIDTDCHMEEEYKNRVDSFFKYPDDKNNRKRSYEWIYNDD